MPANGTLRHARTSRIARKLAIAGTGAAVLALPLIGATGASAAPAAPAAAPPPLRPPLRPRRRTRTTSTAGSARRST